MAHRIFSSSDGTSWIVLAVYPTSLERRHHADRRSAHDPDYAEQKRKAVRRKTVRRSMEKGWLVFKAQGARRRLTPITENWDTCSVEELQLLLERATKARRVGDTSRAS